MIAEHNTLHLHKNTGSQQGQASPVMLLAVLWVISIAAIAFAWFSYPAIEGAATSQLLYNTQSMQKAQQVEQALKLTQQQLTGLSHQRSLQDLLKKPSPQGLSAFQSELKKAFPQAIYANAVPLSPLVGASRLTPGTFDINNNIELDLIRRASNGTSTIEAYQLEGKWITSFVSPVSYDGKVIGALLVSFPQDYLNTLLGTQEANKGKVSLVQKFAGGKPQVIAQSGTGGEMTIDAKTNLENWSIQFSPSPELMAHNKSLPLTALISILMIAVLASGAIVVLLNKASGQIAKDLISLEEYLANLYRDPEANKPKFSNSSLSSAADRCAEAARNLSLKVIRLSEEPHTQTQSASPAPITSKHIGGPALAEVSEDDESPAFDPTDLANDDSLFDSDPLFEDTDLENFLGSDDLEDFEDSLVIEDLEDDLMSLDDISGSSQLPDKIFRAYDIRGHADNDLTDDVVSLIGRSVGTEALEQGQDTVAVAIDGRLSSERIRDSLIQGILSTGCNVTDIGMVPTPVLYFATHELTTQSGVMITGSHNPKEDNGMKIVIAGNTYAGDDIQKLKQRIVNFNLDGQGFSEGEGLLSESDVSGQYLTTITDDVAIAQPLRVVVDAGNGVAGELGPRLIEELGCEVIPLYCEINGNFPNHHPDPMEAKNLQDLIEAVRTHDADLGIAFDGDGDRVGVVSNDGQIIMPDRILMLFAQDVVSRNPGADVIYDVKCTRALSTLISTYGGRPIMWKSGHSNIKAKMKETGALLAGELSGHIFFKERWYGFDDGLYSAARLIEIVSTSGNQLSQLIEEYPDTINTPEIKLIVDEENKFNIIEAFGNGDFADGKITTIDGIRVDYPEGWGLVRASNTTAALTLRFEADNEEALTKIQTIFNEQLGAIDSALSFEIV